MRPLARGMTGYYPHAAAKIFAYFELPPRGNVVLRENQPHNYKFTINTAWAALFSYIFVESRGYTRGFHSFSVVMEFIYGYGVFVKIKICLPAIIEKNEIVNISSGYA